MQITRRTDGRWQVTIPGIDTRSGKREQKDFRTRREAEDFVAYWKTNLRELGPLRAVTPEDLYWCNWAIKQCGGLENLLQAVEQWKQTHPADPMVEVDLPLARDVAEVSYTPEGNRADARHYSRWRLQAPACPVCDLPLMHGCKCKPR